MSFWIFKKKSDDQPKIDNIEKSLKHSFSHIRKDISGISTWIQTLQEQHQEHKDSIVMSHGKIDIIHERVSALEQAVEDLADQLEAVQTAVQNGHKQTDVRSKQALMPVQTAVQTDQITKGLTPMERAIISILLNTELKLSYDDLSIALGRDKSTVRGQLNNIKQKKDSLVQEVLETSGKKRFFIEESVKNKILKERNQLRIKQKIKKRG